MKLIVVLFSVLLLISCQKEKISIGEGVSDTFYLDNQNASMRITVEGNTGSKNFLIMVHGGPGQSAYFYVSDYIRQNLESKIAVVYWDQRNAGASQGGSNGNDLTLSQMTEDLKKLVQLIKSRYGQSSAVFILGHSFGGLLTSSFMTAEMNQSMVKGWIVVDGSHNYSLNDSLTRQKLLRVGQEQILVQENANFWTEVMNWCNAHPGILRLEESQKLESYAEKAESLMEPVREFNIMGWIKSNAIKENFPVTSVLVNYLYSAQADLNRELQEVEFSSSLSKVTIPTLLLYGQYDFICPSELGEDILTRISSTQKKLVISPISGHNLMFQDDSLFCREVKGFVGTVNGEK